ncbi:MAG: CDP-diacylglycerol--serine O-phosphatidyltransferase [Treponema sp.]|jgi:CDP-diacylglycerol--serine O-phosphatidyltransferase|nr:CDP-diacylglycerol--serine O-phosphatidyltransferase [Treponema sp.]
MKPRKFTLKRPPRSPQKRVRIIKVPKVSIKKEELRKGIFILPALFTCGNLSLGILSIISSIDGDFIRAAWFLIGALACDILDGRIARLTNSTSLFGMQLDSLSDLASFGIAPAVMMYMLVLNTMENIGIAIAALFVICSAMRLARFNVLSQSGEMHKHFVGLPTPASAGVIISFVLSYELIGLKETSLNFKTIPVLMEIIPSFFKIMPIVMVVLSFLMVSNIPYHSFKKMKLSKVKTIELLAIVIVLIILIVVYPQNIIFIIFSVYAVSGLLFYLPRIIMERKNKQKAQPKEAEDNDV